MIGVSALAAVLAVVLTSPAPRASPPDSTFPLPSIPPLTTTTTPDDVNPSDGVIVDTTLEWTAAAGLDTAHTITEVVSFDGAWHAFGRDASGPAVWHSDDGSTWKLASRLEVDPNASVVDAAVIGNEVAVAVNDASGFATDAVVLSSGDGVMWESHELPPHDPGKWHPSIDQMFATPGGVVVLGNDLPSFDWLIDMAPPAVVELLEIGRAWIENERARVVVKVDPGITVLAVDSTELDIPSFADRVPRASQWSGATLDDLVPHEESPLVHSVKTTPSGGFVGVTRDPVSRMVTSDDGVTWTDHPLAFGGFPFETWEDAVVTVAAIGGQVVSVDPTTRVSEQLSPDELHTYPGARPTSFATGDAGIVVLTQGDIDPGPETTVVISEGELGMRVGRVYQLEVSSGDQRWTHVIWGMAAGLGPDGLTFQIADSPTVTVAVDDWLAAMDTVAIAARIPQRTHILHSPDGKHWSDSPWKDFAGRDFPVGHVSAFSSDGIVIVVDQGLRSDPLEGVWVGHRTPSLPPG
ncbi:hypothetical protein BH23ACT5_BH23ACT5_16810 [soil metagenome]